MDCNVAPVVGEREKGDDAAAVIVVVSGITLEHGAVIDLEGMGADA